MSPNVGNFVHDLVEMAKAMETLPQVQAELDAERNQTMSLAHSVAEREESILKLKAEIEALHSKLREAEVAKDQAETMFLEADDRTSRALDFIKATFGNAGSLIQALEPARPAEPVMEPQPVAGDPQQDTSAYGGASAELKGLHTTQPQGQSEPLPSPATTTVPETADAPSASPVSENASEASSPAPEVAPAHPTPSPTVASDASGPTLADTKADASDGPSNDHSFSMPPKSPGQFEGKLYSEVAKGGVYPTRQEWEANGGTIDNWYA